MVCGFSGGARKSQIQGSVNKAQPCSAAESFVDLVKTLPMPVCANDSCESFSNSMTCLASCAGQLSDMLPFAALIAQVTSSPILYNGTVFSNSLSCLVGEVSRSFSNQIIEHHDIHECRSDRPGTGQVPVIAAVDSFAPRSHGRPPHCHQRAADPIVMAHSRSIAGLKVATFNGNCWKTFQKFLATTDALVIFGQEHKLNSYQIVEATLWARKKGWNPFWAPCHISDKQGRSSGVCLFVRSYVQAWAPEGLSSIFWKHRGIGVVVSAGGLGPVLMCSCYFYTNSFAKTKLTPANSRMLAALVQFIHSTHMPALIGADWQMEPQVLRASGVLGFTEMSIMDTKDRLGTCVPPKPATPSKIDYFLCTAGLVDVIKEVVPCVDTPPIPHRPVYLSFKPKPKSLQVLVVAEPKRLPVEPPFGPLLPPRDWAADGLGVQDALSRLGAYTAAAEYPVSVPEQARPALDSALEVWFKAAEADLVDLLGSKAGIKNRGSVPPIVHANVLDTFKCRGVGTSFVARALRWAHSRFREISKALESWSCNRVFPLSVTSRQYLADILHATHRNGRVHSPFRRLGLNQCSNTWHPKLKSVCQQAHQLVVITGHRKPNDQVVRALVARCAMFASAALAQAIHVENQDDHAANSNWKTWVDKASLAVDGDAGVDARHCKAEILSSEVAKWSKL